MAVLLVLGIAALLGGILLSLQGSASIVPAPAIQASLEAVQSERTVTFSIGFDNEGAGTAATVDVWLEAPEEVALDPGNPWTATFYDVAPGPHGLNVVGQLREGVQAGEILTARVALTYTDALGDRPQTTEATAEWVVASTGSEEVSFPVWLGLLVVPLAILGAAGAVRHAGSPKIDDLLYLHSSGMLIRHYSSLRGPHRDGDILSGMFVVLQEFVRDSLNPREGVLEEVRYGNHRLLLVRGERSILAAIVRGQRLNGLPHRMRQTLGGLEAAYGPVLARWDGRLDRFDGCDAILRRLGGRLGFAA